MSGNPNVLYITIDGLPQRVIQDVLPQLSTLSLFKQKGISLTSCFSPGRYTQFAMPSLLTSTLPLDMGSYDLGIRERKATLAEIFQRAGYRTAGFSPTFWTHGCFGYGRGFDQYYSLFGPQYPGGVIQDIYIDYYSEHYDAGNLSLEEVYDNLCPFIRTTLSGLRTYCSTKINEKNALEHTSYAAHSYDFKKYQKKTIEAISRFNRDSKAYIKELIEDSKTEILFENLCAASPTQTLSSLRQSAIQRQLLSQYLRLPLQLFNNSQKNDIFTRKFLNEYKNFVNYEQPQRSSSGKYITDAALNWIQSKEQNSFFCWVHYMDIHDENFVSFDYPESTNQEITKIQNTQVYNSGYVGRPRYLASLRYIDHHISRLVESLKSEGLYEETIFVITSDHGKHNYWWGEISHEAATNNYNKERYQVPAFFYGQNIEPTTLSNLASTLDIPTILLELVGLESPSSFRGKTLHQLSSEGRPFVIGESLGQGPCDFNNKPLSVYTRDQSSVVSAQVPFKDQEPVIGDIDMRHYDISEKKYRDDALPPQLKSNLLERVKEIEGYL